MLRSVYTNSNKAVLTGNEITFIYAVGLAVKRSLYQRFYGHYLAAT